MDPVTTTTYTVRVTRKGGPQLPLSAKDVVDAIHSKLVTNLGWSDTTRGIESGDIVIEVTEPE